MPEIVEHGRTGFLCSDDADMVYAVAHIGDIDRKACRAEAQRRFSVERMTRDYERLYRQLLHRRNSVRAADPAAGGLADDGPMAQAAG